MEAPKRLYKYKAFSALTVDLLVSDKIYYADPVSFNDPLDTKPCINPDLPVDQLEHTLRILIENRISAEMKAAAKAIMYRGPKTIDHIQRHSKRQAERIIADIAYNATNPEYSAISPNTQIKLLTYQLQVELIQAYGKGVLSLAARNSCPLMWSHYGDQHHGLCIGYEVPLDVQENLHKVAYGGSRLIDASKVAAMLNADDAARKEVDASVLLRKAQDWRYEKEWRLIGSRGLSDSPLELTDVTFGTRCIDSVKHTVIKALEGRDKPIKMYEMREIYGTFKLKRFALNEQELTVSYPHRARSAAECFDQLE
ncbi:DUF2971 domain-containing protein [Pseudomonas alliivorans]|nr:DUF2971 domain-containing protein [Pseudomonas alliivorans]